MDKITTATRIHPLMAAAALSVITVSVAGTAAITGLLPDSQARIAPAAALAPTQVATPELQLAQARLLLAQQAAAQPQLTPLTLASAAPVASYEEERPVVRKAVQARPKVQTQRVVYREPAPRRERVVYRDPAPRYERTADYSAPAPAPRKPNYVGIGTGAVIGGLIGNQVGGGNGKKLATLAGIIGGGYIGNEVANRNQR